MVFAQWSPALASRGSWQHSLSQVPSEQHGPEPLPATSGRGDPSRATTLAAATQLRHPRETRSLAVHLIRPGYQAQMSVLRPTIDRGCPVIPNTLCQAFLFGSTFRRPLVTRVSGMWVKR